MKCSSSFTSYHFAVYLFTAWHSKIYICQAEVEGGDPSCTWGADPSYTWGVDTRYHTWYKFMTFFRSDEFKDIDCKYTIQEGVNMGVANSYIFRSKLQTANYYSRG